MRGLGWRPALDYYWRCERDQLEQPGKLHTFLMSGIREKDRGGWLQHVGYGGYLESGPPNSVRI